MLCGENGSVDISDFLTEEIKGPATFSCKQENGGVNNCKFKEKAMDDLILLLWCYRLMGSFIRREREGKGGGREQKLQS